MSTLSKIILKWHYFRMNYNQLLFDSCLCEDLKTELHNKIIYHQNKILEIQPLSAPS